MVLVDPLGPFDVNDHVPGLGTGAPPLQSLGGGIGKKSVIINILYNYALMKPQWDGKRLNLTLVKKWEHEQRTLLLEQVQRALQLENTFRYNQTEGARDSLVQYPRFLNEDIYCYDSHLEPEINLRDSRFWVFSNYIRYVIKKVLYDISDCFLEPFSNWEAATGFDGQIFFGEFQKWLSDFWNENSLIN